MKNQQKNIFNAPVTINNEFNCQYALGLEKESELAAAKVTPTFLRRIDEFATKHGFTNRSMALKALIRIGLKFYGLQELNFGQLADHLSKSIK